MAYVIVSLLVAVGWGLKSAMSIPHPDLLTMTVSIAVVLLGSSFWVIVTLHAIEWVTAFLRSDRAYLAEFGSAIRPRMRELLIATPLTACALLATYNVMGPLGSVVAALDAPFYALSIAAALSANPMQGASTFSRWRTAVTLSAAYLVLYGITTGLRAAVAADPKLVDTAPWLAVTSAMAAVAVFLSAAELRYSVETGHALTSPALDQIEAKMLGFIRSRTKPDEPAVRQSKRSSGRPPRHPPPQYGRRNPRRRQ